MHDSAQGILSAKTHSERGGIRLHKSESISYASSGVFPIFQSFSLKKFSYSPVFRISFGIAWSINLTRFSSLWRDVWRDAGVLHSERGSKMRSRKFYETYWKHYDDMVNFENFREMLGGIGDVQARKLLQKKIVKSFKIRGEYRIPKACVIDYVLSPHYAEYRKSLKAQIP